MQEYLDHRCTAEALVIKFLETFKNEEREMDEHTFEVLDELFAIADAFTEDTFLLSEDPDYYVDEHALRERAGQALTRLT